MQASRARVSAPQKTAKEKVTGEKWKVAPRRNLQMEGDEKHVERKETWNKKKNPKGEGGGYRNDSAAWGDSDRACGLSGGCSHWSAVQICGGVCARLGGRTHMPKSVCGERIASVKVNKLSGGKNERLLCVEAERGLCVSSLVGGATNVNRKWFLPGGWATIQDPHTHSCKYYL